jgi:ATP-dependent helicase/nuclease subunit A
MSEQPRLQFEPEETADDRARRLAVDPSRNVALEASAGTGKTRVLVDRYVRLLEVGVAPRNILAITFTRKAAAEMRQRVMATLRERHRLGSLTGDRWREIRDAFGDISISTIDAFCLSLLHEFPLEAGVDPGFDLADETETPRFVESSLDRALAIGRSVSLTDSDVALLLTELGEARLRKGLAALLDRRLVAWNALNRFLRGRDVTVDEACLRLWQTLRAAISSAGGAGAFRAAGPLAAGFDLVAHDVGVLMAEAPPNPALLRGTLDRLADLVLTKDGEPRKRLKHKKADYRSAADYERHKAIVFGLGPHVVEAAAAYRRDLNVVLARGVRRLFAIAQDEYRRTLDKQGVLDFPDLLERTLKLLGQMEEFSRSRYRLESRYEHVLVDEFQDTSRAQWQLVRELVRAWSAGEGMAHGPIPPSIFIVGDRKQSIYAFRDAEVTVLDAAGRFIDALRPEAPARAAITRSYRSVQELLAFVNDVCAEVEKAPERPDAFRYGEDDAFPMLEEGARGADALGMVVADTDGAQAEAVGDEIARLLLAGATVRDRQTGLRRALQPGDIGLLFRTREGHTLFEAALARRGVPFYVYKGLGFFDADEVKDVLALVAYLADPGSNLRAAALLRSRVVRLSDEALKRLAPGLAVSLTSAELPAAAAGLQTDDRDRLVLARDSVGAWIAMADQLPPAEVVDRVLADSAYAVEIGGPGFAQARENLKKVRGLIRRIQNRGYATLGRLADYFAELAAGGDESNAIIDAADAVNLMTVHAAKGLEFPVVFVVNIGKGSGGGRDDIRVVAPPFVDDDTAVVDDDTAVDDDLEVIDASVSVSDYESESDRDSEEKDREETKRLLYVALTRARDRLYLSGTAVGGKLVLQRGSLGRILPAGLTAMAGVGSDPEIVWQGRTGAHRIQRVPLSGPVPRAWRPSAFTNERAVDLEPFEVKKTLKP